MNDLLKNIEKKRKYLRTLLKNKGNRTEFIKWLTTELAYTSNALEGNTLTRKETALTIEQNITSGSKPLRDYIEAKNHAEAFEFVVHLIDEHHRSITEDTVCEIHRLILKGLDDHNAGFYRTSRVYISGSRVVFPNPLKVPELMSQFTQYLSKSKDVTPIKAIETHYKLVSIHPFSDGNGRTARLLMNMILMQEDYPPVIIRRRDRKRYLDVLECYQETGDNNSYQEFMLRALERSMNMVIDLLDVEKSQPDEKKLMKISEFAKASKLPITTIRYYILEGLFAPVAKTPSDYMLFDKSQIKEIRKLKNKKSN